MWKILNIFIISLAIVNEVKSALNGNCDLQGVTENEWKGSYTNENIDDTERTEFQRFTTENIKSVKVQGVNYEKYFEVEHVANELIIKPSPEFANFETNEPSTRRPEMNIDLIFECNDGTAKLAFYQPINDINTFEPAFEKDQYIYQLPMPLPAGFELTFGEPFIACDYDISNTELQFSIDSEDFEIVWKGPTDAMTKCHKGVLKTKAPVRLTSITNYEVKATDLGNPSKTGRTALRVEVDEQSALPPNPQFTQPYYKAIYHNEEETHTLDQEEVIELTKNSENTKFILLEHDDKFSLDSSSGQLKISLKQNLDEEVLKNNVVLLVPIEATLENAEGPGRTVLVVYLPQEKCETISTTTSVTTTECPPCPTTTTVSPECPTISVITTNNPTTLEPTECPTTECPECPTTSDPTTSTQTECPECSECTTKTSLTTGDYSTSSAESSEAPSSTPSIPAECPLTCPTTYTTLTTEKETTDCPPCTTATYTSPLPNPTCPTTTPSITTSPSTPSIRFLKDNYWYDIQEWYKGVLGRIKAIAVPEEEIKYSLQNANGGAVPQGIEIGEDTGLLTITKELDPDTYTITGVAKGSKSNQETQTIVVIKVKKDEEVLETFNSVVIEKIEELSKAKITLDCPNGKNKCTYEIIDQFPKTSQDLFKFKDGKLESESIDILMPELSDLYNPQFSLVLQLSEDDSDEINYDQRGRFASALQRDSDDREWVYLPTLIPKSKDLLTMSIIIEDINNHAPEFAIGDELTVGYPEKKLVDQLAPPYLIKIQATDLDRGLNGKIKYTTKSKHFSVHPETGVVYPNGDIFEDEDNLEFVITATDMDGSKEGQSTELEIKVKPLEEDKLAVLTVKNVMLEELDETLAELSKNIQTHINYLTATVVPDSGPKKAFKSLINNLRALINPKATSDYTMRLVIYALDEDDKPITNKDLSEKLETSGGVEEIEVNNWTPPENKAEEINKTGYIVAISILAVLLVGFMIAVAVFYYSKIHKNRKEEPYATMDEEETGSINYEKHPKSSEIAFEETPKRRQTGFVFDPPPIEEDDELDTKKAYEEPIDHIKTDAIGWKFQENEDKTNNLYSEPVLYNSPVLPKKLEPESPDSSTIENEAYSTLDNKDRKSVSFKPVVKKYNIFVEDEKEDDNDTIDVRL